MGEYLYKTFLDTGNAVLSVWLGVVIATSLFVALARVFSHVKRIQKRQWQWDRVRNELFWSALNLAITTIFLKTLSSYLVEKGYMRTDTSPASWYVVAFEFMLYFFIFDLYFYLVHRLIHIEPLYTWIHKVHHRSITPNPLSSSSMTPIEGIFEGLPIPIFLSVFTVHEASTLLIVSFATIMGLYVHCGHEVVPKWWYKTWATKWFITPMFHDQHHQYFTCNYGAFTTIWDFLFKTVRNRFLQDFDRLKNTKSPSDSEAEHHEHV